MPVNQHSFTGIFLPQPFTKLFPVYLISYIYNFEIFPYARNE